MKRVWGFVGAVLILFLSSANARAQAGATAQISGTVKDSSGAVLPGVDVTATQTDTGSKRNAITDAEGSYTIPNLAPGPYKLEAMLQGFRTFEQTGIVLQLGASPVINVAMSLGQVAETITVQANASLVETKNLGVGQVMTNKQVNELPLNGRNTADLLVLLPAAIPTPVGNATSRSMQGSNGGIAYSLAGGLNFGVSYTLDGATHNNPYDNLNFPLPFPDATGEFKAETSAMTAQNGMHSGGAVNVITKSGSNAYRGDLFEFFRHHAMNATDPFAIKDASGNRKDDGLKRNQYGGTFGGPVAKDKLFFFLGYQGTNIRQVPTDNRAFVPTAAMLTGDMTAFTSPACNNGRQIALGAPYVNNKVTSAQLSKAALNIAAKLPTTTDPCGLVQYGLPTASDEWQQVTKVDYQLNAKHRLFGRYVGTSFFRPPPFSLPEAQQNLLVTSIGGRDQLATTVTVGEDYVISPSTLNSARVAFNRTNITRTSTDFFSAPEVGINMYSYMPHYMLLTITNGFQLGGGTESLSQFTTNEYQFSDDLTVVRGAHQMAFGGNIAHWKSLSLANVRSPGQLTIDGTQTGLGLADFMVGRMGVNALVQAAPNTLDMAQTYIGLYGQDTWRVGSKLTLNLGVRWEPFFPQQLLNGAVYQFDQTRFNQNVHSTVFPKAPAGLYFPGDAGFPTNAGMQTQWGNLGPRVGMTWDPNGDGKTSVRASYGRAYEFVNAQFHLNTSVAPPWGSEVRINSPSGGLDNPFINASGQTNIFPVTFDQNAPFSLNGPFLSLSNDMKSTHVDQWNITIERQLTSTWFASAGYLGSKTSNIWESTPLNNAVFQNVGAAAPSTANINARRPFTLQDPTNGQYYGPVDLYVTDGKQTYNGMILTLRRVAARTTLTANYALSHCTGSPDGNGGGTTNVSVGYNIPSNPGYDNGNCGNDRLQNFSLAASYETPRFENTALRVAATGWRLVGTFRATTGSWLAIT
ncbi:MAG TPA: carboxypeptidase regulatory-like domain-containing protein, partial [Vicinamibacterales bacterium]|nr:carboxypeptidase regulatory-like domain-containing protein [Vicinamibacterales bacterium]